MAIVRTECPGCGGVGTLPPLGEAGNPNDIKRFFPRPCDTCHGTQIVYINKQIEEKLPESKNDGCVTGQGDC